jgi:DNA-binding NtrC family response regulator
MAGTKILFAENDKDFLETRRDFLERAGFDVIPVASPEEARKKLVDENPDVAILDIRLLNDDDEKDISGLELAKEIGRLVPVLLLTGYPSHAYARQALKPQLDGLPAAYDFISKLDGPEAMLMAVKNALQVAENRKRIVAHAIPEEERTTWQQWSPVVALITLLLAMGTGVLAMVQGNPNWLFGTVALAIVSVVLIGITNRTSE